LLNEDNVREFDSVIRIERVAVLNGFVLRDAQLERDGIDDQAARTLLARMKFRTR